jgi:hypothetical protein
VEHLSQLCTLQSPWHVGLWRWHLWSPVMAWESQPSPLGLAQDIASHCTPGNTCIVE